MKNNKLNKNVNKVMTIGMAGAVALSAPLSLVYAAPSADDIHDYTDVHGFCDICGETEENGNHYIVGGGDEIPDISGGGDEIIEDADGDEIIEDVDGDDNNTSESVGDVDESTETETTEATEETDELFTANFYINKYTYKTDCDYIADKLEEKNMFDDYFSVSEEGLKVRFNIYDKDKNLVDSFVISEDEKIEKEVYKSYSYTAELISENIKNVDDFGDVICSYINNVPVLKKYTAKLCDNCVSSKYVYDNKEVHFDLCNEKIIKVDWTDPNFDLKALFENNQEAADFFFPKKEVNPDGTAHDKESCALQVPLPPIPDLPDIPETSESTESTEETTESTEIPSTETTETPSTETTEEPSTETTETPSTETTEEPSTETTETPSTETTETPSTETTEEPSTETTETPSTETTEEPSTETTETPSTETTETPSTETTETPSTETTETPSTETTETPSTETTETPSTETTETPSTETTTTEIVVPTPEPVKPEPVSPVEPSTTTTTTTTTLSPDRGKEEPSTNEIVKTGDMATTTSYGGYFLMAAMAVITPLIRKFKK